MIIILDIHQVIGERELDFEDTYRDVYLPAVTTNGGRLLWFAWLPHGGGEGYEAVSVTAFPDVAAWDDFSERLRYGDLSDWASAVDAMRYTLSTTLHVAAEWSSLATLDLAAVPSAAGAESAPVLFRLDSIAPAGTLDTAMRALEGATEGSDTELLDPVGVLSSWFGDAAGAELHVLYRVGSRERLTAALDDQDPYLTWGGSLATRADLTVARTRLLRTVRWSPLT